MQNKSSANGHAKPFHVGITLTPDIRKDGDWYIAFCPEVPEANGQGKTRDECLQSLKAAVLLLLEDRREDAILKRSKATHALKSA